MNNTIGIEYPAASEGGSRCKTFQETMRPVMPSLAHHVPIDKSNPFYWMENVQLKGRLYKGGFWETERSELCSQLLST